MPDATERMIRMDKDQLKKEIKRIQKIMDNKSSHFIHDELQQYMKLLKRQLKQAEKEWSQFLPT